jgi:RHS repeat-associated protein
LARTGTTIVSHLYRGEQFDPNLGWYYLRARFYDPKSGRFPTMDAFEGVATDPPSLHKYQFVSQSPVNRFDPSGHLSLPEMTAAQAVMVTGFLIAVSVTNALTSPLPGMQTAPNFADPLAEQLLLGAARIGNSKIVSRDRRRPKYPVIVFGADVLAATTHYFDAIAGEMLSPLLHRKFPTHIWRPGANPECFGRTGAGTAMDCDEYPFKSAVEGGPINYSAGRVSLRPVQSTHNQSAGSQLFTKLYAPCKIVGGPGPGSKFAVIANPAEPTTYGVCGNGQENR